ncbi:hypothetical protein HBI38_177450 [Parastagonospora nodorum]|nr:hypothetical protein HBI41_174050 [Parastagonospora nodorum]KAH6310056.1 hypothetical protein HBI38_177450 [Parastagonospora nodorum]
MLRNKSDEYKGLVNKDLELSKQEISAGPTTTTYTTTVLQDERQYSTVDDRILNRYIFAIMTLLRQTRERSSRDSICDAMTLISDEYETLYAESLRTTTAKEHIRQIARVVALRQNSLLQSTAPDSRLRTITHLARRKMRCNYNPETRLRNNDGYAEAVCTRTGSDPYTNGLTAFIRTLEREVGFEDKRSGIYYYTKTADGWTCIRISTEARWHGALQDTVATKLYRATFVIELLI